MPNPSSGGAYAIERRGFSNVEQCGQRWAHRVLIVALHSGGNAMKLLRRHVLRLAAGAAALPFLSLTASAQAYPTRPVRIIVPFAPGGSTDISARLTGQWLSERLGQQFVIENRPGAGSNVGTEVVVNAPPDGYTLLLIGASSAINMTLYEKLSFNFLREITPIAGIISISFTMVVGPSFPAKTVSEFIAYAKVNPGKVNIASGGNGTAGHLSGELFKMMAGVNMVHVPYRGEALALTDMLGGQVQVMFATMPASIDARQGRQAAGTGGNNRDTVGGAAGDTDGGRVPARL
jgi:tripartite-type tricarboxylate transporter receptor subunit TctC